MTSICMLSNLFPPIVSGSATHCSELARELAAQGHRVSVITAQLSAGDPIYEEREGVAIHRLPCMRLPRTPLSLNFPWLNSLLLRRGNIRRVERIVSDCGADVVHVHNHMFDAALIGAHVSRKLGLPMVLTIHTVIKHTRSVFNALLTTIDASLLKWVVVSPAAAVICPDRNVEKYLGYRFGRRDGALIPYNVAVPKKASPDEAKTVRDEFGLNDRRFILSLGHVHALRNRVDLIKALALLRDEFPDIRLLLVGSVSTGETLAAARAHGVEDLVVFCGAQPHARIPVFLEACELEAHWLNQESVETTSPGIATLEAMAYGRAVISAANPDTFGPGLLQNGRNIALVDPSDPRAIASCIAELLRDPEHRERIGQQAQRLVIEHFDRRKVAIRTLEIYRRVIGCAARQPKAGEEEPASPMDAHRAA